MRAFDLTEPLPSGRTVLEASAGTGKTYSLTGLVVRYIAEAAIPVDQFLVVTFTRAAANELRDRTRSVLDIAAAAIRDHVVPAGHPWMSVLFEVIDAGTRTPASAAELDRRRQRLLDATLRFDELTITTIHGFCQQSLAQLGVRSGIDPDAVLVESVNDVVAEVCRDAIITTLADHSHDLDTPSSSWTNIRSPKQAEAELISSVMAMMSNPGAVIAPKDATDHVATRWVELACSAHDAVLERQRARHEIGYDTLVSGMQRALADPAHGPAVAAQMAQRSSVVLVDEFQDTDRLQWEIFDRAFSRQTLVTVGDPKQAIYRFRGADVHAYLDAVAAAPTLSLAVNHRSDAAVLDGLGQLLDGATLGDPRIPFVGVAARPDAPAQSFTSAGSSDGWTPRAAVHLRAVPVLDRLRTPVSMSRAGAKSAKPSVELSMPLARSLILADLVERVIALLDDGSIVDGSDGTARRVSPGDIAVLVPSHMEAANIAAALRRARIPAVRTRTGSVLTSPAAMQWRLLLAALAQPHQTPVVRAAALGWFMHTDVGTLADDDEVLADLQSRVAELAERLRTVGIGAFYDEQKAQHGAGEPGVVDTVLGRVGGERDMTDLDHISELLAAAMRSRSSDATQALRCLDELITDTDERNEGAMRRIHSDAMAVQITTIHAAKGLEYPIVLLPFAFKQRGFIRTPHSYTTPAGQRTLDLASKVAWDGGMSTPGDETTRDNQELRRQLTIGDIEGDELRLLYVALTRAKHRVEIWWASTRLANTSALGRVLLDRYGAGPVQNSTYPWKTSSKGKVSIGRPTYQSTTDVNALAQIHQLATDSDGTIELTVLPGDIAQAEWGGAGTHAPQVLRHAVSGRGPVADHRWARWSFSRLHAATPSTGEAVHDEPATPGSVVEDLATVQREVRQHDDRGGFDEPVDETADADVVAFDGTGSDALHGEQLQLGVGPVAHLADVVGGTRFGTFVHAVLEHLDFTAADLRGDVHALVVEQAAREGLDLAGQGWSGSATGHGADGRLPAGIAAVVDGIVAAVRTPLGPLFAGRALADFAPRDRLAELVFDMPIAGTSGGFAAGAIGDILQRHLERRDPLRPFARLLSAEFATFDLSGWMHGSVDGVFRVPVDGGHRYAVVDYKTNRLHMPGAVDPVAAYHPRHLVGAMEHSRYPLQALLYTIALHRYLRWRLGRNYSPEQHLGGVGYLFVRGMVGPATPQVDGIAHGVFSWLPPVAAVVAIDELFATGRSA